MVQFPAEFSSRSRKYIKKLDSDTKLRLRDRIDKLEEDPFPSEVERVKDYKEGKAFRVRVGEQRILYLVQYNPNKIIVSKIDKRSRVYN
ncbi:type II toxin-antitoxin system RelE/ParE family toxin [Candidatus Woesearchaeota archaeon]|nr:type II toxin-antitoxin system RelE/ParE family toxin [Candidatus Woesearchaeota archaeon]